MGITSLTKISSEEKYDDILSWPVPLTWTLENAATVPLTYALVSIREQINQTRFESVFNVSELLHIKSSVLFQIR